jgi:hypothetical protein
MASASEVIDMKTRNGFVANSSSSSFLIRCKDLDPSVVSLLLNPSEVQQRAHRGFEQQQSPLLWMFDVLDKELSSWQTMGFLDLPEPVIVWYHEHWDVVNDAHPALRMLGIDNTRLVAERGGTER